MLLLGLEHRLLLLLLGLEHWSKLGLLSGLRLESRLKLSCRLELSRLDLSIAKSRPRSKSTLLLKLRLLGLKTNFVLLSILTLILAEPVLCRLGVVNTKVRDTTCLAKRFVECGLRYEA